ncbi:MAG: pyridoxamine 5-phosphate oxidase [Pseudomonadota bacterium]|jgi:pyridoxamine 5'-phosphate oxidase
MSDNHRQNTPHTAADARTIIPCGDPLALFDTWLNEAKASEPNDPNAMALATATASGAPSLRMVLLKGHGPDGFVFYTNAHSRKGTEIAENAQAALLFHWKSLRRQIRVEGELKEVPLAMADAYFASRARDSQLGAVASDQSAPLDHRQTFLDRFADAEVQFAGDAVIRPAHWTGFRLTPSAMEFWTDRPHRLHERRRFTRSGTTWASSLLYP